MFKIEKGVKIIPARTGTKTATTPIYPFRQMKAGDSFLVPFDKDKQAQRRRLTVAVHKARNKLAPASFSYRTMENGYRVWRVA